MRTVFVIATCLFLVPTGAFTRDDSLFQELVQPEVQRQLAPPLFGDSHYNHPSSTRNIGKTDWDVHKRIQELGRFQEIEDTIFKLRPNVIEWNIRFYDVEGFRLSYAAAYMTCYSIRKQRDSSEFVLDDWRSKPRPYAIVSPQAATSQVVLRTWASDSELRQDSPTDLGHCLSHSGLGKDLGIERTFVVDGKLSINDGVFNPILEDIEAAADNVSVALSKLRLAFETGLHKEWTGRDVRIRLRQAELNLTTPTTSRPTKDYSKAEANHQPSFLEKRLRENINLGVDRIFKLSGDTSLHDQRRVVPKREDQPSFAGFFLAVLSAVTGSVVEDILLTRILDGRSIYAGEVHVVTKVVRYTFIISLVWVDLLPLAFFVVGEISRRKWKANGLRTFVHTTHATGKFENGTRTQPAGHGIVIGLETWRVHPTHDNRLRVAVTFLVVGIVVHILVLGHRTFSVVLKSASCLQNEAKEERKKTS